MSDEADKAEEQEEMARAMSMKARKPAGPVFTGLCANCDLTVEYPLRWCCKECRDDWDKREGTPR